MIATTEQTIMTQQTVVPSPLAPSLVARIQQVFTRIWEQEMAPGDAAPDLAPDTVLLETGLDSMGFAIFVSELEEVLGYDPFAIAEDTIVYPQTFAEFLAFYEAHKPAHIWHPAE